jgi:MSHA biogenesis protein MshL
MNHIIKKMVLLTSIITGLAGCVSQDFIDNKADADKVQAHIETLRPTGTLNNVVSISRPPVNANPIDAENRIAWLDQTVNVQRLTRVPLVTALTAVMAGTQTEIRFDNDVQPNTTVSVDLHTTRQNILNVLSSQTGYAFTPSEKKIVVQRYLSKTFIIQLPTGAYSAQQGSQGQSTGKDDEAKVEGQFISVTYKDKDVFTEISEAVKVVLKSDDEDGELIGDVQPVPSMSGLTVRTTPVRMRQVQALIDSYQSELNKQVLIDIRILEFRSNLGKDRGVDWQILKEVGDGTLKFLIPGTTTSSAGNPAGLAFTGTGKWDGTTAFIKALEQQGTVSTETPISFRTLSSQPARISQTLVTPFLEDFSTVITDNTTTPTTTRGSVTEGVDMTISANVQKGFVWLRTAGKLTKIASDTTEQVADVALRFISTRSADLNFTNKLRYGQTVVIGSIKQQTTGANKSASFGIDGLGMQSTNNQTVETLILLTPRRVQ